MKVTINQPVVYEITQAEFTLIRSLAERNMVQLVKFLRTQYGWDLSTAKKVVDTCLATEPTVSEQVRAIMYQD